MAEPSVKTISAPNNRRNMIIGNNHHFLLAQRKLQNSFIIDNLPITSPPGIIIRHNLWIIPDYNNY